MGHAFAIADAFGRIFSTATPIMSALRHGRDLSRLLGDALGCCSVAYGGHVRAVQLAASDLGSPLKRLPHPKREAGVRPGSGLRAAGRDCWQVQPPDHAGAVQQQHTDGPQGPRGDLFRSDRQALRRQHSPRC